MRRLEGLEKQSTRMVVDAGGSPVAVEFEPLGRRHRFLKWDCALMRIGSGPAIVVPLEALEYSVAWVRAKAEEDGS